MSTNNDNTMLPDVIHQGTQHSNNPAEDVNSSGESVGNPPEIPVESHAVAGGEGESCGEIGSVPLVDGQPSSGPLSSFSIGAYAPQAGGVILPNQAAVAAGSQQQPQQQYPLDSASVSALIQQLGASVSNPLPLPGGLQLQNILPQVGQGTNNVPPQAQAGSIQLGQPQYAQNLMAGLSSGSQQAQVSLPGVAMSSESQLNLQLQQGALIEQLRAQIGTQSQTAQQQPSLAAPMNPSLLQQLAAAATSNTAPQNAPLIPFALQAQATQNPQIVQMLRDNVIKNQMMLSLLLSQQQTQTLSAGTQLATSTNPMDILLRNMSANGLGVLAQAQGLAGLPLQAAAAVQGIVSSNGTPYRSLPAEELKEKRWNKRYEELIQFQQVSC